MQIDFHYYATYCAALIAGYTHEESLVISYSDQFVDCCSRTLLDKIKGPAAAATTQLQLELMETRDNFNDLADITRIWASFHFLPRDLSAPVNKGSKYYRHKYRLICGTNSDLLVDTVRLARNKSLQHAGIAMHVLSDTWAHRYFAGTPSLAINNTNYYFYESVPGQDKKDAKRVIFRHNPSEHDDISSGKYINTIYQMSENSVMYLGHGRAGHLPDYSFARYRYLPAWKDYEEIVKDNPSDYYHAFCQMIYAMQYLRGETEEFRKSTYADMEASPWRREIMDILTKRRPDGSADWKALGESISGREIEDFDIGKYQEEYRTAPDEDKDDTFLGRFIIAALAQKSMVTGKIFQSGNPLAGVSVDYELKGFAGIGDFIKLVQYTKKGDAKK